MTEPLQPHNSIGSEDFPETLGTITVPLAGVRHHRAKGAAGERPRVVREPDNPHDANAMRVTNAEGEPIGYVPREDASFLAPLADGEVVTCQAEALDMAPDPRRNRRSKRLAVRLRIGQGPNVSELFAPPLPDQSPQALVHQLVLRTFRDLPGGEIGRRAVEAAQAAAAAFGERIPAATRLLARLLQSRLEFRQREQARLHAAALAERCRTLQLGQPVRHGEIVFVPVLGPRKCAIDHELIDEAVRCKHAVVGEVASGPTVNRVHVRNVADKPILGPQGWMLLGAMQDRVLATSVVLEPGEEADVPVCCVEAGRWHGSTGGFAGHKAAPPSVRRRPLSKLVADGAAGAQAAQHAVWDSVRELLGAVHALTPTGSLHAAYQELHDELERERSAIALPDETSGVIVFAGGEWIGMDLFADADTFRRAAPSLLDGYLLERRYVRRGSRRRKESRRKRTVDESDRERAAAADLLQHVATALLQEDRPVRQRLTTPDEHTVSISMTSPFADNEELVATAVGVRDEVLHFTAFAAPQDETAGR
ncbi:MAG: hypothetical protein D6725_08810 [Planctomycetota bacterium]|nr:MAG: hypothetical protein D6725_08810 [Planctomycetota bacterium]